jgi:hypothetical protein
MIDPTSHAELLYTIVIWQCEIQMLLMIGQGTLDKLLFSLVCQHIGDRKNLEAKSVASTIEHSNPVLQARSRSEVFKPMKLFTR